ncbi:hypothetical protein MTR_4g415360 [Medicago truncatula]|uniref:Uncharacterized protein n=1 Tax=Medicago truncatula TaxID=3880 RepID=A0A072UIH9_MEDTR|nr:hypothetical protein MTR_4g415360 [Medicago truncatula]
MNVFYQDLPTEMKQNLEAAAARNHQYHQLDGYEWAGTSSNDFKPCQYKSNYFKNG